jgi:hypothetical protein
MGVMCVEMGREGISRPTPRGNGKACDQPGVGSSGVESVPRSSARLVGRNRTPRDVQCSRRRSPPCDAHMLAGPGREGKMGDARMMRKSSIGPSSPALPEIGHFLPGSGAFIRNSRSGSGPLHKNTGDYLLVVCDSMGNSRTLLWHLVCRVFGTVRSARPGGRSNGVSHHECRPSTPQA